MKIRKLLVYKDFKENPYIILKGKWLQKLGFNFHDYLELETYEDKIIIRKVKDPKPKLWVFFITYNPACPIER